MQKYFARGTTAYPLYLGAHIVRVEVDIDTTKRTPQFTLIGLPDKSIDEARDRIISALKHSSQELPKGKITVSLTPADMRKEGSYGDLALALTILAAKGHIPKSSLENTAYIGELSLDGTLLPKKGILVLVEYLAKQGITHIFVPRKNAHEASLVHNVSVYGAESLVEVLDHIRGEKPIPKEPKGVIKNTPSNTPHTSMHDIKGQEHVKRGLVIAAAGGHNVGLIGPPGTGKTLLARAFIGLLPELNHDEALRVAAIHSLTGSARAISTQPPFRSPHHSASHVAIVGGGANPQPGELTLAHKGVLFLDEFPLFEKRVIESLRGPLEDRVVHIARAKHKVTYPADATLVIAMNPCPCGNFGARYKNCTCSPQQKNRYQARLSGPIVDRIDMWLVVEHVDYDTLLEHSPKKNPKHNYRNMVILARQIQKNRVQRFADISPLNSRLSPLHTSRMTLEPSTKQLLNTSAKKLALSPRAYHRTLRVARTIADVEGDALVQAKHILEALSYRSSLVHENQ